MTIFAVVLRPHPRSGIVAWNVKQATPRRPGCVRGSLFSPKYLGELYVEKSSWCRLHPGKFFSLDAGPDPRCVGDFHCRYDSGMDLSGILNPCPR